MNERRPGETSIARVVLWILGILVALGGVVLVGGCSALLGHQNQGPAEAERLIDIVEDLPGVSSVTGDGSSSISYTSESNTYVTMSTDATPEQIETVLITWKTAANPDDTYTWDKWLSVSLDNGECRTGTTDRTPVEQLKDTVAFLPELCALTPDASVDVSNDRDERWVRIEYPEGVTPEPLDLDALRLLPAVTTGVNEWAIAGVIYDWGTSN
jgi:hypothetical protein